MYDKWKLNVFKNIGNSEQTHMDRVKELIKEFNLKDPLENDVPGKFTNNELQTLYNDLVEKGNKSIYDALFVGATIEDLDIYDLEKLMGETKNQSIIAVFTNLRNGSINHIKAFNSQMKNCGNGYKAQFITQEYLKQILN